MKKRCLIRLLFVATLLNQNSLHIFIPPVASAPIRDIGNNTSDPRVNTAYPSPIARLKINQQRQQKLIKDKIELESKKAIDCQEDENRIKENSEKFQSKVSPFEDVVVGGVLLAFGTLSLLGHSYILFYYEYNDIGPVDTLFLHQSILDLLTTCSTYPMPIFASFNHKWIFQDLGCLVQAFLSNLSRFTGTFFTTSITIIQYLKICESSKYSRITRQMSSKLILWCYLVGFLLTLAPLFGFEKYDVEPFGMDCGVSWIATNEASRIYILLITVFAVFVPLATILFCYFCIARKVNYSTAQGITSAQWVSVGIIVATGFVLTRVPITLSVLMSSFVGELVLPMSATPIPALLAKLSPVWNVVSFEVFTKLYQ